VLGDVANLGVAMGVQNQFLWLINQLIYQRAVNHFLDRGRPVADVVAVLFLATSLSLTLCLLLHCFQSCFKDPTVVKLSNGLNC
jgi:hypothetical protein